YNLQLFDPTWLQAADEAWIAERLEEQSRVKRDAKLRMASDAYARFLKLGGALRMEALSAAVFARYLDAGTPLLVGVSATYLYQCARQRDDDTADAVPGKPQGHFVGLAGKRRADVLVADPWPEAPDYERALVERLITAILLGVLT